MRFIQHFVCRVVGHHFEPFCEGFKRQCSRCAREEWVVSNEYPRLGEPKTYWKHMDWNRK